MSIDFEQNLSSLCFSFDKLIGRSHTEVLPPILIKYRKEYSAKNAIILYVQEIQLRRDLAARSLSAFKHCKIDVHNSSESIKKDCMLNELPRRRVCQNKSMLFKL